MFMKIQVEGMKGITIGDCLIKIYRELLGKWHKYVEYNLDISKVAYKSKIMTVSGVREMPPPNITRLVLRNKPRQWMDTTPKQSVGILKQLGCFRKLLNLLSSARQSRATSRMKHMLYLQTNQNGHS